MPNQEHESATDRESRLLLIQFLTITDGLLERVFKELVLRVGEVANTAGPYLNTIWGAAKRSLRTVTQSLSIGLPRRVRRALHQVGMFGEELKAKFGLLTLDIREGAVRRVLKRLNSMLSSLAKIFSALHAAKEFKDHVEATVEGLRDVPEFIDLRDILPAS